MPRDVILINMRRGDGDALGVKTKDGFSDVSAAGRALDRASECRQRSAIDFTVCSYSAFE
jgi:hypothetical protein